MSEKVSLFNESSGPLAMGAADQAGVARAMQEVQAALVIAKRFPRDEVAAIAKIKTACQRKELAERAEYEYSRGGTRITGPTIDLLLAVANRWGNILYGWDEVDRANGQSRVRCYAWDLENNNRPERTFFVRHWRDTNAGGYALKDERDIYEMISNQASRRVRACLEQVVDQDVVQLAVDACRETLKRGEKVPLRDRAVQMVVAFADQGVTQSMIERRLGNKIDAISENQLASLRRVYKSIQDGVAPRDEYFKTDPLEPTTPGQEQKNEVTGNDPSGTSEPVPGASAPTPPAKAKEPKKEAPPATPLATLRGLCKHTKIKEGELLAFLATNGSTDGSVGSLEELQMSFPGVITMAVENWAELSARIQGA